MNARKVQNVKAKCGMKLTMQLSGRFADGQAHTYAVALPNGDTAFLIWVSSEGWELTIRRAGGLLDRRGVFATTDEIMALLESQFNALSALPTWPLIERRATRRRD